MKLWYIALKDLKIRFKDIGATVLLFVVPIFVMTITGVALSGNGGKGPTVLLIDLDKSELSREITKSLKSVKGLTIMDTLKENNIEHDLTEAEARKEIESGKQSVAIVIPKGFYEKVKARQKTNLVLLRDPGNQIVPGIVQGILGGIANRVSANVTAIKVTVQEVMVVTHGKANPEKVAHGVVDIYNKELETPPVGVRTEDVLTIKGKKMDSFKQQMPGYAVMFALFSMLYGGSAILREKEQGTFRRLLAAPVSKASILIGKLIPNFVLVLLQLLVFFLFGHFVFGMELGKSLFGLVVISCALALATTSLTIFMAAVARSEGQLAGMSVLIVLAMSSLGGSWWPLDIVPPIMRFIGHLMTINAWAVDGLKDILWYGRGVTDILPDTGALLLSTTIFFSIGLWRFRMD